MRPGALRSLIFRPVKRANRALIPTLCACTLLSTAAFAQPAPAPAGTTLETTTQVPPEQDACLDHSIKELGMSAKKVDNERRWTIGPQFLHPSVVKGGTFGVKLEKGEKASLVRITATWPGAPKAKDVQVELQSRLTAMAAKMAQICGVTRPEVKCELKDLSGKTQACAPQP